MRVIARSCFWAILGGGCVSQLGGCSGEPDAPDSGDLQDGSATSSDRSSLSSQAPGPTSLPSATTARQTAENASAVPTSLGDTSAPVVGLEREQLWDELTYPCSMRDGGDVVLVCDRRQYLGQPSHVLALPKGGGESSVVAELAQVDALATNDYLWVLDALNEQILRLNRSTGALEQTFPSPYFASNLFGTPSGVFATSYEGITWFGTGASQGYTTWYAEGYEEVWLMTADESSIYFTVNPPYPADPNTDYRVLKLNVDLTSGRGSGEVVQLASGTGSAKGIAVTSDSLIYADNRSDKLYSVPLDDGEKFVLADIPYPWSIGVDDTHVYVASRPERCTSGGAVYRVPLSGGAVETIADEQVCPSNVLVTESEVFWLNAGPEQPDGDPAMVSGSYATIMRAFTHPLDAP